ncbi:hypothetical protein RA210_U400008 [Rubrivivax sp. A210]|nr:hypothetical protein RA210_U400008 [Rubrivivax sp. A210]
MLFKLFDNRLTFVGLLVKYHDLQI